LITQYTRQIDKLENIRFKGSNTSCHFAVFYETSLGYIIKLATVKLYNFSGTGFINVNIQMTTSQDSFYHLSFQWG